MYVLHAQSVLPPHSLKLKFIFELPNFLRFWTISLNSHSKPYVLISISIAKACHILFNNVKFRSGASWIQCKILIAYVQRALEKLHFSSIVYSKVIFSSNDMLRWNMRASEAIERFRKSDFPWIWFNFFIMLVRFLRIPWISQEFPCFSQISLNFWNSLTNSLRRPKFLKFRPQKEISLKVEAFVL